MAKQKDRHLEAPGEANRDKHINFLAEENGDVDPADENYNDDNDVNEDDNSEEDNGFFTDDDNRLQTKEEHGEDAGTHADKNEKVTPLEPDTTKTLGDEITVNADNEDIVTLVTDDNPDSYDNEENEDDEAH